MSNKQWYNTMLAEEDKADTEDDRVFYSPKEKVCPSCRVKHFGLLETCDHCYNEYRNERE